MTLKNTKLMLAVAYVVLIGGIAIFSGVSSGAGLAAFAALALLPAGALMVLWNDPPHTLSETIRGARR